MGGADGDVVCAERRVVWEIMRCGMILTQMPDFIWILMWVLR